MRRVNELTSIAYFEFNDKNIGSNETKYVNVQEMIFQSIVDPLSGTTAFSHSQVVLTNVFMRIELFEGRRMDVGLQYVSWIDNFEGHQHSF